MAAKPPQGVLPFKIEKSDEPLMARVGLVLPYETARGLKLPQVIDQGKLPPLGSGHGYKPSQLVMPLVLMPHGGGIGLVPLRSLIWNVIDNRDKYGRIDIVYGARSPADLCFQYDLDAWDKDKTINMATTVDRGDDGWTGRVGVVPKILEEVAPSAQNAVSIVCGPPIMIRFAFPVLTKLGFTPEQMLTTLEKRMKCGIGKCGRCNIGNLYVCRDGPVFSYAEIKTFISSEY
jgi:NAD(P)H-flavin reductase